MKLHLLLFSFLWYRDSQLSSEKIVVKPLPQEQYKYYDLSIVPPDAIIHRKTKGYNFHHGDKQNDSDEGISINIMEDGPVVSESGEGGNLLMEDSPTRRMISRNLIDVNITTLRDRNIEPVLFFINRNSGGQAGAALIQTLRQLDLHPVQICDLRKDRPSTRLKLFSALSDKLHVLVAGGDGTLNWLMDELFALNMTVKSFGIIPLGTGNDLYLHTLTEIQQRDEKQSIPQMMQRTGVSVRNLQSNPKEVIASHIFQMSGAESAIMDTQPKTNMPPSLLENTVKGVLNEADVVGGMPVPQMGAGSQGKEEPKVYNGANSKVLPGTIEAPVVSLDRWNVEIRNIKKKKKKKKQVIGDNTMLESIHNGDNGDRKEGSEGVSNNKGAMTRGGRPVESLMKGALVKGANSRKMLGNFMRSMFQKLNDRLNPFKFLHKHKHRNMVMSNYIGFGVDGAVSLSMDIMRTYAPYLFFHSMVNKFWYGVCGLVQILFGIRRDLSKSTELVCDGVRIDIPAGIRGIVILNINSYAGGVTMWSPTISPLNDRMTFESVRPGDTVQGEIQWGSARCDDGLLEVMGVYGIRHLGLIKSGLVKALPLCQGKDLGVTFKNRMPMQVDGEPFMTKPSTVNITFAQKLNITTLVSSLRY